MIVLVTFPPAAEAPPAQLAVSTASIAGPVEGDLAAIAEEVALSRAACGLPPVVEDLRVLDLIAALLKSGCAER